MGLPSHYPPNSHLPAGPRGSKGDKGDKGDRGPAGPIGPQGRKAYAVVAANFVVPSESGSTNIIVDDATPFAVNDHIRVGTAGSFIVTGKIGNVLVATPEPAFGNASPGTIIPSGESVVFTGEPGPPGQFGQAIVADTTEGPVSQTLPRSDTLYGDRLLVALRVGPHAATLNAASGETVNGESSLVLNADGDTYILMSAGTNWVATNVKESGGSAQTSFRVVEEDTTWHMSTAGDDVAGDGTAEAPWETLDKLNEIFANTIILPSAVLTIQFDEGDHSSEGTYPILPPGGGGKVTLRGDVSDFSKVELGTVTVYGNGASLWSNRIGGNCPLEVEAVTFDTLNAAASVVLVKSARVNRITATASGRVCIYGPVRVRAQTVPNYQGVIHCNSEANEIYLQGDVEFIFEGTVTGDVVTAFCSLTGASRLYTNITGNPSTLPVTDASFAGTVIRLRLIGAAVVTVDSASATYFPGNAANTIGTKAQYASQFS